MSNVIPIEIGVCWKCRFKSSKSSKVFSLFRIKSMLSWLHIDRSFRSWYGRISTQSRSGIHASVIFNMESQMPAIQTRILSPDILLSPYWWWMSEANSSIGQLKDERSGSNDHWQSFVLPQATDHKCWWAKRIQCSFGTIWFGAGDDIWWRQIGVRMYCFVCCVDINLLELCLIAVFLYMFAWFNLDWIKQTYTDVIT